MSVWAAVLAGGSGTRFWPLSTPAKPKQFLPLAGRDPLLVETLRRLDGLVSPERILLITGHGLAEETRRLLPALPPQNVLGEPRAASTGPALTWATSVVGARDPEGVVLSLHADWWVGDAEAFRSCARRALAVAQRHDVLVTVGVEPRRPEVGYGYVERGAELAEGAWVVARFTEKPDRDRAAALIADGALWNSGLFAWTVDRFFAETRAQAPEIAPHLDRLAAGDVEGFFRTVTPIAVDVALFERSRRVAVVAGTFAWDDVGTWGALARVRESDAAGNVAVGDVFLRDCADTVVWAEDGGLILDGMRDVVVVRAHGRVLVTTRERASDLKQLLETLPAHLRDLP